MSKLETVVIEYPKHNERLPGPEYTFRIRGNGRAVEVSVDGGDWLPCRESVGYWWYDWRGQPGPHRVVARERGDRGPGRPSSVRRFTVRAD